MLLGVVVGSLLRILQHSTLLYGKHQLAAILFQPAPKIQTSQARRLRVRHGRGDHGHGGVGVGLG